MMEERQGGERYRQNTEEVKEEGKVNEEKVKEEKKEIKEEKVEEEERDKEKVKKEKAMKEKKVKDKEKVKGKRGETASRWRGMEERVEEEKEEKYNYTLFY